MEYCARCVYPANAKPAIIFDDDGVCSGCRYHESRARIDWQHREQVLREMLELYKHRAAKAGRPYDCIIPVSGGKDSHFQVHLIKNVYGMNPLLVTYNHSFNTALGIRNLQNLVTRFGCDLVRFTTNPQSARSIARYMLKKVGDVTWHYHAGIRTFPFRVAVQYQIPLIIWGEHGFAELTGMFTLEDMVEFTKWTRQEHDMRGFEPHDLVGEESGLTMTDLAPFVYPADEQIEEVGIRGVYLSNFVYWSAKEQADLAIEQYGFNIFDRKRDRTFVLYAKIDDHANDVHDYLKYLKFGYGRATDDASMEVRHGRLTRSEAIDLVADYDHTRPRTLDTYLGFLGITEDEFEGTIEQMRDPAIWCRTSNGQWHVRDSVANHRSGPLVEAARLPLVDPADRTFSEKNRHLYYREPFTPRLSAGGRFAENPDDFTIL